MKYQLNVFRIEACFLYDRPYVLCLVWQLKGIIKSLENCRKTMENDGQYLQAAAVTKQLHALKVSR
jgi:hypothetical protein